MFALNLIEILKIKSYTIKTHQPHPNTCSKIHYFYFSRIHIFETYMFNHLLLNRLRACRWAMRLRILVGGCADVLFVDSEDIIFDLTVMTFHDFPRLTADGIN